MNLKNLKMLWKEDKSIVWYLIFLVLDSIFLVFYTNRVLVESANGYVYVKELVMMLLCIGIFIGMILCVVLKFMVSIMEMMNENYILVSETKNSFLDYYTQIMKRYDVLNAIVVIDKKDDFTPEEFGILIKSNDILKKLLINKEEED